MSDLISRATAIDAVKRLSLGETDATRLAMRTGDYLERLPPAQPEIIHCKDCKFFEYDHLYVINDIPVFGHELCNRWGEGCKTSENGWCFLAERKEDEVTE